MLRLKKPMQLPSTIVGPGGIAEMFKQAGKQLYVVGGAVRDHVLNVVPKDFDLATDALPTDVCSMFNDEWTLNMVGASFGVVKARSKVTGEEYEIATFREDIGHGRRPEAVRFTTIEGDVKRRDFTMNALFYDIDSEEVVDLVGGLKDIENRVLNTVGDPFERFKEDRLRILRAIRFTSCFAKKLDKRVADAISVDNRLDGVSPERIHDEVVKSLSRADVTWFINLLERFKMWPQVFPGLRVSVAPDALCSSSGPDTKELSVFLAVLLDQNDRSFVAKRLSELKYSNEEVNAVSFLLRFRDMRPEDAYALHRQQTNIKLKNSTVTEYALSRRMPDKRTVLAYACYVPKTTGELLLSEGFSGKALGQEMTRREAERFMQLCENMP